jgi:hypothetical protein
MLEAQHLSPPPYEKTPPALLAIRNPVYRLKTLYSYE